MIERVEVEAVEVVEQINGTIIAGETFICEKVFLWSFYEGYFVAANYF